MEERRHGRRWNLLYHLGDETKASTRDGSDGECEKDSASVFIYLFLTSYLE